MIFGWICPVPSIAMLAYRGRQTGPTCDARPAPALWVWQARAVSCEMAYPTRAVKRHTFSQSMLLARSLSTASIPSVVAVYDPSTQVVLRSLYSGVFTFTSGKGPFKLTHTRVRVDQHVQHFVLDFCFSLYTYHLAIDLSSAPMRPSQKWT